MKSAFIYGDSISERVRQFRLERISRITANEAPVQLHDEITFVLHTIPLQAMGSTDQVDLQRLTSLTRPADLYSAGFQQRFNVDGLLIHNVADGRNNRYKQVFRSGAIEYAHAQGPKNVGSRIDGVYIENEVLDESWIAISLLRDLGVGPPAVFALAIVGAKGAFIGSEHQFQFGRFVHPIDRDLLIMPDVIVDSFDVNVTTALKPLLDGIWNASGHDRSPSYDNNGAWNRDDKW